MLGADSIYVELDGEAFELRPSLRASMRLVRRHQLPGLLAAAQNFNLTIILDMMREVGIKPALLLAEIATCGLGAVRNRLAGPLATFVLAVAGIDPNSTDKPQADSAAPLTPEEFHTALFQTGTGWLGWTPEATWNATPAEIIAAKAGRTDMIIDVMKAVFGTSETDATDTATPANHYSPERLQEIEEQGHDPAFDRSAAAAFKMKMQR